MNLDSRLTALQGVGDLLNLHHVVIVVHDAGLLVVWTHGERRETWLRWRDQHETEKY